MATLCRNCATPLLFDPNSQRVVCRSCGSFWTAEEVESTEKALRDCMQPIAAAGYSNNQQGAVNEFIDCYIYTCASCGGEVNINGSEVSTTCIYCGSTSVVFSRISRERAPEYIIPFSLTKEQALECVKENFSKGAFIPKEIKNLTPSTVRGIYVPYWLVRAYHVESDVIRTVRKSGKTSRTEHHGRTGTNWISGLPVDASTMLSDASSQMLEPWDFSFMRKFDEDYLLGFYSNISDIHIEDLYAAVHARATEAFQDQSKETVLGDSKKIVSCKNSTLIDPDVTSVMLPVWFITYQYQGKHNTIMVNGQDGKVVCGIPLDKKAFFLSWALATLLISLPLLVVFYLVSIKYWVESSATIIIGAFVLFGVVMYGATNKLAYYFKQVGRTQSSSILNFVKKRQE